MSPQHDSMPAHAARLDADLPDPRTRWQTTFLALTAMLSSTILLKVASIQYLELLYLLQIVILLVVFARRGYRVLWFRPFLRIGILYLFFAVVALVLTAAALRYDFYVPLDVDPLKAPGFIAISRIVELIADVSTMLYLAHIFRLHPGWLRFTMRIYFWTGTVSAVLSLISYPFAVLGIAELLTHQDAHRLKGFYGEGGPYGLYVLSLIVVGMILWRFDWERPIPLRWGMAALLVTLLLTRSKAGFVAAIILIAINTIVAASLTQRLIVAASGVVFLVAVFQVINLSGVLLSYTDIGATYERASHFHSADASFVYGRVAGLFIVPRMVAAHPLAGIGLGNYGYLRNDPQYRGAAVWVPESDDASLGVWDLTADVGLPMFGVIILCLLQPFLCARRHRAPYYISTLALLPLIVHLCGAQLNLTYPWVIASFALGLIYAPLRTIRAAASTRADWNLSLMTLHAGEHHA